MTDNYKGHPNHNKFIAGMTGKQCAAVSELIDHAYAAGIIARHERDMRQTLDFHNAFEIPVLNEPKIPTDRLQMRLRILEEEVLELREAAEAGDLVEVLDALIDIKYIVNGTALEFGLQDFMTPAYDEVHRSNMSKLGLDGKPIHREDGKVLKGPNYSRPNLSQFILGMKTEQPNDQ